MSSPRNYIGLSTTSHDSAIAIVDSSGKVIFAEGTERWMQNKRSFHVAPDVAFRTGGLIKTYCEPDAELVAAFTWSENRANQIRQGLELFLPRSTQLAVTDGRPRVFSRSARRIFATTTQQALSDLSAMTHPGHTLNFELKRVRNWPSSNVEQRFFDHHLTHAAAGCLSSPMDTAVCAIVDGFGEGRASACYAYKQGRLTEIDEGSPRSVLGSLGLFYMDVCEACGFNSLAGEEWKVMGLAAYGKFDPAIYRTLKRMISVDGLQLHFAPPALHLVLLEKLDRHSRATGQPALVAADLAYTAQRVFEETLYELLRHLYELGISENLILGGGCALNSSANGGVLANTQFKRLHVFCAPGDDGNAVGAALLAYMQDHPDYRPPVSCLTPYLGSHISSAALRNLRRYAGLKKIEDCGSAAPERAAALLASGLIVGWIQGAAEFGPRALGNRSILADPRSADIKDRLNEQVKFREEFRPFAPAILHEYGPEYFEDYQESPYMERTLRFRPEVRSRVPGAVHVDGTGRLQTVRREYNEPFHRLLSAFHCHTGIPLVINTSYNVMGKPIAHSVEDIIAVYFTSGIDAVFIESVLLQK